MSNDNTKADCLTYPGQPDNVTRDELIAYFEELANKAAPEVFPGTRATLDRLTVR